jgi:D-serine deaminase-like pyridoxal phosphate-dependent protein
MMEKEITQEDSWYRVQNIEDVVSPSLLVFPARIEKNILKMIEIAGGPERLRPHVKTHKMPEVIRLQMKHGITKFKCATIAEAEMVASCGSKDILLAMQPVGPNLKRFFSLQKKFPDAVISFIADTEEIIIKLSDLARKTRIETHVWLDINVGMNRTGVTPGEKAVRLFHRINDSHLLVAEGLHVYDGHIHEADPAKRKELCDKAFEQVIELADELKRDGVAPLKIVAGGTPSFPVHALRKDVELSPGTLLLWDFKSGSSFTDMDFLHAAVLVARVVSKPAKELICIDLGHKALASEMPQPRIFFFGLRNYTMVNHSEEHLVIRTKDAENLKTGDVLYGIPFHICPTVDRYDFVNIVEENKVTGQWPVEARKRKITI